MSLNFYADIDNFKVDSKGNVSITVKLEGWGLNNQLDNLSKLKEDGRAKITIESAITHKPDFVIYDRNGHILHVYDVKSSLDGRYGADPAAKLRFNLFQRRFKKVVEVVVPRKNDFKVRIFGLRKNVNTRQVTSKGKVQFYDIMRDLNYDPAEFFK